MSIKDQIRAEIERLIDINKTKNGFPAGSHCAIRIEAYELLLDFLDTLPEQPASEGLEEEIDRLWESFSEEMSGPHNLFDMYRRLARHFAEWGAEHLKR